MVLTGNPLGSTDSEVTGWNLSEDKFLYSNGGIIFQNPHTNFDVKLITKSFANRMSKVMPEVIHESQTANIPGRYVHDNLRSLN